MPLKLKSKMKFKIWINLFFSSGVKIWFILFKPFANCSLSIWFNVFIKYERSILFINNHLSIIYYINNKNIRYKNLEKNYIKSYKIIQKVLQNDWKSYIIVSRMLMFKKEFAFFLQMYYNCNEIVIKM